MGHDRQACGGSRAVQLLIVTSLGLCIQVGCGPPPPKVSPQMASRDVPGLRPGDIESCAQQMARDLVRDPMMQAADPAVRVGLVSVENHTNEPFVGGSADMVTTRIQTILFRALRHQAQSAGASVKFIVMRESVRRAIEEQRAKKRAGDVTHRGLKDVHGVDYFLSGIYQALDKRAAGQRLVDMVMTFDLTDAETGEIVWTHDCLVKTITRD